MKTATKHTLKRLFKKVAFLKPSLEAVLQVEAWIARSWVSSAHKRLMGVQWAFPPQPEHFDHHIDLYYVWLATRNPLWVERGAFGGLALRGGNVLELACGDGFNARNFYSSRSKRVISCDFDPLAVKAAKRKNAAPNVEYLLADIRTNMPAGKYENIIWDTAIEHFTPSEIENIMLNIKSRLTDDGILSGSTIVEKAGGKSLSHHEYEFKNKQDLLRFFTPHFIHVTVFETIYPDRHNLYFWASDHSIPFGTDWSRTITVNTADPQEPRST